VKKYIKETNDNCGIPVNVKEPLFVFLTAFNTASFRHHVSNLKVRAVYEKPLQ
jgi:hypothetical protein